MRTRPAPDLQLSADRGRASAAGDPASGERRARGARRRSHRLRALPALVVVALVAAACSSHTTTSAPSTAPPAAHHRTGHHHAAGHHRTGIVGTVTAVSTSSLGVDVRGATRTVALTPTTSYRQGGQPVAAAALAPGERVHVRTAANGTAKVVLLLPASSTGTVVAVQAQGFTLHTPKGATLTVTTTSSTTYREGTRTVTAPALQQGDKLRIHGQPGPSGSFTATKVTIVPAAGSAG